MILTRSDSRWAKAGLLSGMALTALLLTLYLAGYFYLWKLRQPPWSATPLTVIQYAVYYGHLPTVRLWLSVCLVFSAVLVALPLAAVFMPVRRALHGDARLARRAEIKKAGLLTDKGIILGRYQGRYLMLDGQQSVLCAAPPRSGKGVGLVQPNMLNWPDSVVILDIRRESFRITSGYRAKHGHDVYLFNPLDEDSRTCQWNPLSYVSDHPELRINDLQKIANMLSPDPPEGDPFWPASCRTLFLGLGLYLFETPGLPRTLGEMMRQIMHGEAEAVGEHWRKLILDRDKSKQPLSPECKAALHDFINTSPNTQSSIRKTFTSKLELWINPLIDLATSTDSFDLRDLRRRRISLYLGVDPADLGRLRLLLNLLFQQILDLNTRQMPQDNFDLEYQLLLLMDEFTAIGRMPILADAISYIGGYNIRALIVIQGPSQLRATYGPDVAETITTCMGAQIAFAPKEQKHAVELSEALGYQTVSTRSRSRTVGLSAKTGGGSVSVSEQRRALFLPQEIKDLGADQELVFMENVKPILAHKIRYYADRRFKKRLQDAVKVAPLPSPERPATQTPQGILQPATTEMKMELLPITPKDMDVIDTLQLDDFSCDFTHIQIPQQPVSDTDMKRTVDSFLLSMAD